MDAMEWTRLVKWTAKDEEHGGGVWKIHRAVDDDEAEGQPDVDSDVDIEAGDDDDVAAAAAAAVVAVAAAAVAAAAAAAAAAAVVVAAAVVAVVAVVAGDAVDFGVDSAVAGFVVAGSVDVAGIADVDVGGDADAAAAGDED
ncbi:hypothetical protein Q9L58_006351 [Maublancomyces gigas]|uniref:Uncharacterized protein n=1 Tax=Discina gigas TaxID=1032678 RepID=A0ABR3GFG4_9PEZI